jgi:hypothetical protein
MDKKITVTLTKKEHQHLKHLVYKGLSPEILSKLDAEYKDSLLDKLLKKLKLS